MSPETDCAVTLPTETASWCWSPLTVATRLSEAASPISTSPETALTLIVPPTKPSLTSPEAVLTVTSPLTCPASMSPLALFTIRSPPAWRTSTSPEAVLTATSPRGPRVATSADFVRASSLDEPGHRTRHEIPWRPKKNPMLKPRPFDGMSTRSASPRKSMRAASTSACDSSSCAVSSSSTRPSRVASTTISPEGIRRSSDTGPEVSKVFCMSSSLALGVAGQALAGGVGLTARLRGARDRSDEPRVRGDALAGCGLLDRGLEGLRQAQADAGRQLLARHSGLSAGRVDVHEFRLLACQADLHVARRELRGHLHGGLRENVEELQPEVGAEDVGEAAGDCCGALVAKVGRGLQVFLERFEDQGQIHRDITMTSSLALVKQHLCIPRRDRAYAGIYAASGRE